MFIIKCIVFVFIFCNGLLSVLGKEEKTMIRTDKNKFFQSIRNKIINFIANKKGFDRNGWMNMSIVQPKLNSINVRIENDHIICNEENQVLEVSLVRQNLLRYTDEGTYHEILLSTSNLSPTSQFINPLPLMKKNHTMNNITNHTGDKLPDGFEGYLICEKKNSQALLVPKIIENVEFISAPWKVRVSIDFYRCPITNFGRVFQIIIIDHVNVLMNNQRSFVWPIPLASFSEVYDFHLAVVDTKKGHFCELERNIETQDLNLNCPCWNKSYKFSITNALFLSGYIGMNVIQAIAQPFLEDSNNSRKHPANSNLDDIDSHKKRITYNDLIDNTIKNNNDNNINNQNQNYDDGKKKYLKKLNSITHLIYLSITALTNTAYSMMALMQIKKNLDLFNKAYEKAPYFYPWSLKYPENYLSTHKPELLNHSNKNNINHILTSGKSSNNFPSQTYSNSASQYTNKQTTQKDKKKDTSSNKSNKQSNRKPTIVKQVQNFITEN
ncbi:hypothetical protein PRSY57_1226200 [Plasmodium reichenowi]|uniref:Parasitophorous vacuolar protein 2 n=1 Tax=Plasmodium reichenowi TaxID=5854 RepID=A0A151L8T2_PLARE|nr:hypothetical protein PRSY57_1226200 [Plasmodium reichenowi]KYN95373.1 hypothetical protein PRSY57_1226200 [Plasmodium reichenowi]